MRIVVNEQELDVTLQQERTIGDVVTQLEQWLADSGMSISHVRMDDLDVSDQARSRWESKPLEDVEQLELRAALSPDRDPQSIITLIEYVELLIRNLEQRDDTALSDVLGEFGYLRSSLGRILRLTGTSETMIEPVETLAREVERRNSTGIPEETCKSALQAANALHSTLQSRLSEVLRPEQELKVTASLIDEALPEVSRAPVLLQQGRDTEAMESIARFSDLVAKFTRLNPEFGTRELIDPLNELLSAFDNGDTVLIGDLLEYEIVPVIEQSISGLIERHEE